MMYLDISFLLHSGNENVKNDPYEVELTYGNITAQYRRDIL